MTAPQGRSITLTGTKAVLVLVALGAFAVFRFAAQRGTLDSDGQRVLATWLAAEYTRAALRDGTGADSATAARLLDANAVTFTSLAARGRDDDIVVRAEIRVAGQVPPVGKPVRYFCMRHNLVGGWTYQRETTALAYYTRLF